MISVENIIPASKISRSILLFVFLILVIVLTIFKLFDMKTSLSGNKLRLASLNQDLGVLDGIMRDSVGLESEMEEVLGTLPRSYFEVAELIYKIETLAKENSLSSEISFDKEKKEEAGVTYVLVQVTTRGGYQNYLNFLNGVSGLPYITTVDSATLETKEGSLTEVTTFKIFLRV